MKHHPLILVALLAASTALSAAGPRIARAQESDAPAATPAMLAAARVDPEQSGTVPSVIEITRGDTINFEAVLRDAAGQRVEGARWGISSVPNIFDVKSIKDSIADTYLLWGVAPGATELRAVLIVPGQDQPRLEPLFTIPVRVLDWPVARIELDRPAYATYTASTFSLSGRVITIRETEHMTATLAWSSSNPEVVEITPEGVATFRQPGRAEIRVQAEGLSASYEVNVVESPVAKVTVTSSEDDVRTGDVVRLDVTVTDRRGRALDDAHVVYSVSAVEGPDGGAVVYSDGAFVAEYPGVYQIIATASGLSASALVSASPREAERAVNLIGRGPVVHVTTSDLWVFEGRDGRDYAYTGTHAEGGGGRMFVWDVTDPEAPVLTDSIVVDARVVNDVKVNDDATVAIITREGASNRKNGIVVLDIQNPAHPVILSELTDNLTAGIHNTWFNGDVVYAVNDGTGAVDIIDLADPANPRRLGRWEWRPGEENKYVHDVWAQDGLAYLSYWDDGLIILDVGAGTKGGTPREPKFVSQYRYPIGNTHAAYRYGDYVFVGDEIFGCAECTNGPRGYVHVVDVRDIEHPYEVARFEVPEAGAHNFWVEDGVLYVAYYQGGLRVVDVTGELRGDLYAQGRQISHFHTAGAEGEAIHPNSPMAWGPQPHKGRIFMSDLNSGLWIMQLEPAKATVVP